MADGEKEDGLRRLMGPVPWESPLLPRGKTGVWERNGPPGCGLTQLGGLYLWERELGLLRQRFVAIDQAVKFIQRGFDGLRLGHIHAGHLQQVDRVHAAAQ